MDVILKSSEIPQNPLTSYEIIQTPKNFVPYNFFLIVENWLK